MSKFLNIKIFISLFFLFFLFELFYKNEAKAACTSVNGVLQSDSVNSSCETQPEIYQVRIYQVMLCTSQPTAPTTSTSSGLSMCQNLISNDTGSVVRIDEIGGDGQTIAGDTNDAIANRSYTWSVVKLDNTFGIQGSFQFADPYNGEVSGSGNSVQLRYYLHPDIHVEIHDESVLLRANSEKLVKIRTEQNVQVLDTTYHDKFGSSKKNKCLLITGTTPFSSKVSISWN